MSMPYIIAEIGVNHDGCLTRAIELIESAHAAGADCVKMQSFAHLDEPGIERLALSAEAISYTRQLAHDLGIDWLCTPFSIRDAADLYMMGVKRMKVASKAHRPDEWYWPLVEFIGSLGVEVILSTGGMTFDEVIRAVDILQPDTVLQCTSRYPCPIQMADLAVMEQYSLAFDCRVGFSDHTEGIIAAIAAAALGAKVIEKHITYDTTAPGPDHAASLDPATFKLMVESVAHATYAIGNGIKVAR